MMMKDQELIENIVKRIKEGYNPEKIILFGSYAEGNPGRDSDIDMLIIKDTDKKRPKRFVEVSKIAYDPSVRVPFSPLVFSPDEIQRRLEAGDEFIKEILEKGEVLYDRGAS